MIDVVGRDPEIAAVVRWFTSPGPSTMVVSGAAGLGKTTVWTAATTAIGRSDARVLASSPTEAESRLSYSGLADLLGAELGQIRGSLPPPQARALAVAMRFEDPGDRPTDETAVARGVLEALVALARRHRRLLVAIDDLRWLDAPSLAAVVYVARRLPADAPIRVLATHRASEPEPTGLDAVADIERLALGPVSVGGIHRIVRQHVGVSLSRPRLLELHATTLGNPLHAVELARTLAAGGAPEDGTLASLFGMRIAALPVATRSAVVLLAASADRAVDRLDRAWSGESRDLARVGFGDAIRPAVEAGLVALEAGQALPSHPLVTHIAYDAADDGDRRAAHRSLAATAATDEERAGHLGRSVDAPDGEAADAIETAARDVRSRGVRALSAALFESAAQVTPPAIADDRHRRWLAAASAWYDAGDTHRVEVILEPLIVELAPGVARAEARWRLGVALDEAGRWHEATALWREALAEPDALAVQSLVRCSLAITAMYTESMATAITWAESAVVDGEASADPAALARSLAVEAFLLAMAGRPDDRGLMTRALALEAGIDEPLGEWSPLALAAECARQTGDVRAAIGHYAAVLDRAASRGDANVEQWAAFGLAVAENLAGGYRRASELADLVLDLAEQTDVMQIPARSLRAHVDANLGHLDAARARIDEAIERARAGDETTHLFGCFVVLAAIEISAGDAAAAASAYGEARRLAQRLGLAHAGALRAALNEAEVAATAGELAQAEDALSAFDTMAGSEPPPWSVPVRRRARASIHAARGDLDAGVAELDLAIDDALTLPPDRGRALLALGSILRRMREIRRSREATERALAVFEELASPPWIAAANAELARLPGRRSLAEGDLTNAEVAIAALVASGLSNREVAAELVLSVKTIEVTLTRIYAKLGLRSRSELAAQYRGRPAD